MPKKNKKLVIVESPAKAKTLEKFLGKGFEVKACGGHVRDLPSKRLGVDIKKNFEPSYATIPRKTKILKTLKSAAKEAELIFLAPDPDREGEAIAWHLSYILGNKKNIKRIEFNEITKEAVTRAVEHPRSIDLNRVNAQQARRILDRLMGYKLSPLLWRKIQKGLSAGRVQSVAVRLICEREKQIRAFKPKEYWSITARLSPETENLPFEAKLILKNGKKIELSNAANAKKILKEIEGNPFTIKSIKKKEQKRRPPAPFITSSLQQEAARKLGFSTKKTMTIAQGLYEGVETEKGRAGIISYMRTDSVRLSKEAEDQVRKFISSSFGASYLPAHARHYKSRKQAQDAHEAIRPTKVQRTPEQMQIYLNEDQLKLYSLIWKRFVACQMEDAIYDQTSVDTIVKEYTFRSTGRITKFDGFTTLYQESSDTPEVEQGKLPNLQEDTRLTLLEITPKQHFTEPPPRYNEASLVKELEEKGIGRPSTYAPIISTIIDRRYIEKEGRALKPTDLGLLTNEQLVKHFPTILDIKFTAKMEDELDEIVAGKMEWVETLKEFYAPFEKSLAAAEKNMARIKFEEKLEEKCPQCGKNLMVRVGRFGRFIACSGYPKCKYTRPEENAEAETSKEVCKKCGKPMVLKHSRFGKFMACSGYPTCKNIKPIKKEIGVKCPLCGGDILERRSKKGRVFFGCSRYPKCKFALWNRPTGERCPRCRSLLIEKFSKKKKTIKCSNQDCGFEKESTGA